MPQHVTELPALPQRPEDSHKGTFGRVLLIAGSRGMSGGAALAGLGALRGGAGLVFVAVPQSILPIVAAIEPSYLTVPLPEDDAGRMTFAAHETLSEKLTDSTAVGVGPGWGQSDDLAALARRLYMTIDKPIVFDADALNALA
ncbi:MAG: ADP-dependent NAD(P)H-hydrate dehydratase, partial [Planctomycetaceae bacterium]